MPIYEYRCTSCGAELEKLQKISDPPLIECPECGKDALVKLISASSFRLKGSGWYETDFKTGKKKNGAAEATGEGAASADASKADAAKDSAGSAKDGAGKAASGEKVNTVESSTSAKEAKKDAAKSSDSSGTGTKSKPAPTK
jgi:putative FmdB family regulatory protein